MKRILSLVVAFAAALAWCKDVTWTGGAQNNKWSDDGNWDKVPAAGDTMVFNGAGDLAVSFESYGDGNKYLPGSIKVNSGNVTMTIATSERNIQMTGLENELFVASGSTLTVEDYNFWSFASGATCRKTGAGMLVAHGYRFNHDRPKLAALQIEAGKFLVEWHTRNDMAQFYVDTSIVVFSGAELFNKGPVHGAGGVLDLREGSVFRLQDDYYAEWNNGFEIDNLTGAGDIIAETGTAGSIITLRQTYEVEPYVGTASGNVTISFSKDNVKYPFIVQSTDQFANIQYFRKPGAYLQFAAGIGTFNIGIDGSSAGTVYVQDVNGGPVRLNVRTLNNWATYYAGAGEVRFVGNCDSMQGARQTEFTGWFGTKDGWLKMGRDNSNFNFSKGAFAGVIGEGAGGVVFDSRPNTEFMDIQIPVRGNSESYTVSADGIGTPAKFSDLVLNGAGTIYLYGQTEFAGGDVNVRQIQGNGDRTRVNQITGGRIYNGWNKGALENFSKLKSRRGVTTDGSKGGYSLSIEGGEFWWSQGNALQNIYLRGGVFHPANRCIRHMTANSIKAGPVELVFDGGVAQLDAVDSTTFEFFRYGADAEHDTFDVAANLWTYVTEKGGKVVFRRPNGHPEEMTAVITNGIANYPGVTTSGRLTFDGWANFVFGAPLALTGPVAFRDGTAEVTGAQLTGSSAPFGTGDIHLRNAAILCDAGSGAGHGVQAISLAGGADSKIIYEGSAAIVARQDNSQTPKAISINAIERASKGSVLYLRDGKSHADDIHRIGADGGSTVKFAVAPEVDATTGLLRQPVIISLVEGEALATYDVVNGIVPHDTKYTHVTDYAQSTAETVYHVTGKLTIPAGTTVRAAALILDDFAGLTHKNAPIYVGNGTDPAIVSLGCCGCIRGEWSDNGVIDFGTSEGIISLNDGESNDYSLSTTTLRGSGGVTYAGDPDGINERRIRLYRKGLYTGGTRISGVTVIVSDANCLGDVTSPVEILGGERAGGSLVLNNTDSGSPFSAYNLKIAGRGYHCSRASGANNSKGALEFWQNMTVSGNVEITEPAWVNVKSDFTGKITGVVSGDRLNLFDSAGVLRLENTNVHTGGTEVARSTVVVTQQGGLGTGELLLDDGTVEFENTAAVTVANKLRGIGTLRVKDGAVNFTGDASEAEDVTVDYAGVDVRLTSYPTFAKVKNSAATRSTLTLAAPGAYTIDPAKFAGGNIRLVLEAGATLDLGGGTLTVERFTGDKAAVNGTIVETNPRQGMVLIVR